MLKLQTFQNLQREKLNLHDDHLVCVLISAVLKKRKRNIWLIGFVSDVRTLLLENIRRRIFLSFLLCQRGMNLAAFVLLHRWISGGWGLHWGNFMGRFTRLLYVLSLLGVWFLRSLGEVRLIIGACTWL